MRLINYTTKPGLAEANRALIAGVFKELHEAALSDFRYAALESGEGHFLHLVESTPDGSEALQNLPAFRTFVAGLRDRQEAPNVITELRLVGNYGRLIGE